MLEFSTLQHGDGGAQGRQGPPHVLPGVEMKENACPEGGRGEGPGQPETCEKHRKCLQKQGRHVNRFTRLPPFSPEMAVLEGPGGCLRRPGRPGGAPWETLGKHEAVSVVSLPLHETHQKRPARTSRLIHAESRQI